MLEIENWLEKNIGFENPKMGLSRIKKALKSFNLKTKAKIITIAGTNGKGGTARALASALDANYRIGLHTSPHIHCITERFYIDNTFIDQKDLLDSMEKTQNELSSKKLNLSYFEFLFFIFWQKCCSIDLDYIILEVGLGGRLDATNSIDADIAIITSISRDHQDFLGTRYDQILTEKIGISRMDKTLITSFKSAYLNSKVEKHQQEIGFNWYPILANTSSNFIELNECLANKALSILGVEGIPSRINPILNINSSELHLYGSHNLDAIRKLVQYLKQKYYNNADNFYDLIILSFSKRKVAEIVQMIILFKYLNCKIIILGFDHFKAMDHDQLKNIARENGLDFASKVDYEIPSNKKILVSGSNYFIGQFSRTYS